MTFASGAVRAAEWVSSKPAGLYSMQACPRISRIDHDSLSLIFGILGELRRQLGGGVSIIFAQYDEC